MKKSKLFTLTVLSISILLQSCATTSSLKGEKPVMNSGRPEVIDYQGQALGSTIPGWVVAIGNGETKKVAKALDIQKSESIFVLQNKGKDLDYLKTWTEQVDIRSEVASSIEQTVAQTVQAELELRDVSEQQKRQAVKIYSAAMTNITLNGLKKEAGYWILTRTPKTGVKRPSTDSDYNFEYTYFSVYSINSEYYEKQLKKAMDDIQDNDSQTEFLKEILTTKLTENVVAPEGENISFVLLNTDE